MMSIWVFCSFIHDLFTCLLSAEKHDKKGGNHGGGLASMMALGKLAFQAADALAPMPNDFGGKNLASSTPTTPVLLSPFAFAGSPLMGSTDSKSTPPSSTCTTPEAKGPIGQKKGTLAKPDSTDECVNGKAVTTTTDSKDIKHSPKIFEAENPGRVANGFPLMSQDNVSKNHSMDADSIRTESEDFKCQGETNKSGAGDITTSQATQNSSPGALEGSKPSDVGSASPDNVGIEIEDPSRNQTITTTATSAPNSRSVSCGEIAPTPNDGHVNSADANSKL